MSNIRIFLISFNRLTPLRAMVNRLTEMGAGKIVVVDNASTYPPLIDYLAEIESSIEVLRMRKNLGHGIMRRLFDDKAMRARFGMHIHPYVYSDCDIVPTEDCPRDFIRVLLAAMTRWGASKAGLGLKIDDLPACFEARDRLIGWESQFWQRPIEDEGLGITLYLAPIDTTLAVRRANSHPGWSSNAIRTGPPYLARHLPWYSDTAHPTEEELFYMKTAIESETHFPGRYREVPQ